MTKIVRPITPLFYMTGNTRKPTFFLHRRRRRRSSLGCFEGRLWGCLRLLGSLGRRRPDRLGRSNLLSCHILLWLRRLLLLGFASPAYINLLWNCSDVAKHFKITSGGWSSMAKLEFSMVTLEPKHWPQQGCLRVKTCNSHPCSQNQAARSRSCM